MDIGANKISTSIVWGEMFYFDGLLLPCWGLYYVFEVIEKLGWYYRANFFYREWSEIDETKKYTSMGIV